MSDAVSPDYRHARDIPDVVFLSAVERARALRGFSWATRWDVAMVLGGLDELAGSAQGVYDVPGVPAKVVLAKADRLVKRGLMSACTCGCRGDFDLTPTGVQRLTSEPKEGAE